MRHRFRASRERGRTDWRAHPTVYRSYAIWSTFGAIALAGAGAFLARGAGLVVAALGVAVSAAWAAFWIWVISFHTGLVQDGAPRGGAAPRAPRASLGLPNVLTLLRVLLAPAVGWAILAHARLEPHAAPALVLIFLVGFSDVLDGVLARLLDWQTPFGRYLDHLADVLIMNAVVLAEYAAGMVPGWLTALVVIRYAGTGIGGVVSLMLVPGAKITPTWIGKVATFVAGMTLFLTLAHVTGHWPLDAAMPWLFAASGVALGANIVVLAYQVVSGGRSGR
jgi:phosphatidylglycerophosphate synthase